MTCPHAQRRPLGGAVVTELRNKVASILPGGRDANGDRAAGP